MAKKRPPISEAVKNQLWARAAGRCEFWGCNELLYIDGLTQKHSNLAQISHIVAFSPEGARGDSVRSKLLEKDINNLMLTCYRHGKLIDDKTQESDFPEELLLEYKREHEQRVRRLTETKETVKTRVLVLTVSIGSQNLTINQKAVFKAILPKYPAEELPVTIDLGGVTIPNDSDGFFTVASHYIEQEVQAYFRNNRANQIKNLSIFALAPIPLLIYFGVLLGDIEQVIMAPKNRTRKTGK